MSLATKPQAAPPQQILGSYQLLTVSFHRYLPASNKAPPTVQTYGDALRLFGEFLAEQGMPPDIENIQREHVERWVVRDVPPEPQKRLQAASHLERE